jgi:hypothetical protein
LEETTVRLRLDRMCWLRCSLTFSKSSWLKCASFLSFRCTGAGNQKYGKKSAQEFHLSGLVANLLLWFERCWNQKFFHTQSRDIKMECKQRISKTPSKKGTVLTIHMHSNAFSPGA